MIQNFIMLQDAGGQGAGVMNLVMIVVLIAIFYFFMIRPQQKKQKEMRKFRDSIAVGDSVMTAGGIYGKVRRLKDNYISIEVAKGVEITVDRSAIYASAADLQSDTARTEEIKNTQSN